MISAQLRTVGMMAGAIASAMTFYTISLKVSADRAEVQTLRRQIASDLHDIRGLEAELRTRSRLPQLERWNDDVLALSAPEPKQFANGAVELAAYAPLAAAPRVQHALGDKPAVADGARLRLASATIRAAGPAGAARPAVVVAAASPEPLPQPVEVRPVQVRQPAASRPAVRLASVPSASPAVMATPTSLVRLAPGHATPGQAISGGAERTGASEPAPARTDRVALAAGRAAAPARAEGAAAAGFGDAIGAVIDREMAPAPLAAGFQTVAQTLSVR